MSEPSYHHSVTAAAVDVGPLQTATRLSELQCCRDRRERSFRRLLRDDLQRCRSDADLSTAFHNPPHAIDYRDMESREARSSREMIRVRLGQIFGSTPSKYI